MSNKIYTKKYIDLVEELMRYINDNGKAVKDLPTNASFVAFSYKDKDLNTYTQEILNNLLEGKKENPIIKAEQQKTENSWKFTTMVQ